MDAMQCVGVEEWFVIRLEISIRDMSDLFPLCSLLPHEYMKTLSDYLIFSDCGPRPSKGQRLDRHDLTDQLVFWTKQKQRELGAWAPI